MNRPELTCPFCNAPLAGAVREANDGHATCPRCGERLPAAMAAQLTAAPPPAPALVDAPHAPGKKKTLAVILAIMAGMAALATVYALVTRDFRRQNDYRTQKKTEPGVITPAAEASLVGFLPVRTNVLAVVQVNELLKSPATRRLLEEPPLADLVRALALWTGLAPSDIEQVALGAEVATKLPQVVILVQTRRPYSPGKITAALAPAQPTQHLQKTLVRFALQPAGEGLLWCHSDQLIVFVLGFDAVKSTDLDVVPLRPRLGTTGFAEPLRAALSERLPASSPVWLAAQFEQPNPLGDLLALTGRKTPWVEALLQTKMLVISLQAQDNPTLTAHFHTGADEASQRLQALLEARRWQGAQSYKVAGPPPGAEATDQWVTLQARGELGKWLATWQRN